MTGSLESSAVQLLAATAPAHDRNGYAREIDRSALAPPLQILLQNMNRAAMTGEAYKSVTTLAQEFNLSKLWTRKKIKALVSAGWLVPVESKAGGRGHKNRYRLAIPDSHGRYLAKLAAEKKPTDEAVAERNEAAQSAFINALYSLFCAGQIDQDQYDMYASWRVVCSPRQSRIVVAADDPKSGLILSDLLKGKVNGWTTYVRFSAKKGAAEYLQTKKQERGN